MHVSRNACDPARCLWMRLHRSPWPWRGQIRLPELRGALQSSVRRDQGVRASAAGSGQLPV